MKRFFFSIGVLKVVRRKLSWPRGTCQKPFLAPAMLKNFTPLNWHKLLSMVLVRYRSLFTHLLRSPGSMHTLSLVGLFDRLDYKVCHAVNLLFEHVSEMNWFCSWWVYDWFRFWTLGWQLIMSLAER